MFTKRWCAKGLATVVAVVCFLCARCHIVVARKCAAYRSVGDGVVYVGFRPEAALAVD